MIFQNDFVPLAFALHGRVRHHWHRCKGVHIGWVPFGYVPIVYVDIAFNKAVIGGMSGRQGREQA